MKTQFTTSNILAGLKRRRYELKERNPFFDIPGTKNLHSAYEYFEKDLEFLFTPTYDSFTILVNELIENAKSASILKFGDGDYYF